MDPAKLGQLSSLLGRHHEVRVEDGCEFAEVLGDDQPRTLFLARLSKALHTDVVWLGFQSVVDAFEYRHWRNGECVRELVYGCYEEERRWERVTGQPQPWEDASLWTIGQRDAWMRDACSEGEREEIRAVWASRRPRGWHPSVNGRETARAVAHYFRFPGWS
jgi:hypothetical protein